MAQRLSYEKTVDEEAMHIEVIPNITEIGTFRVLGLSQEDADFFADYSEEQKTKTFRKVGDMHDPMIKVIMIDIFVR